MKVFALKGRLNIYLYKRYPGILSNFENGAKQLEAQLKNGVANKKKCVHSETTNFIFNSSIHESKENHVLSSGFT